jgi:hypothetical protein
VLLLKSPVVSNEIKGVRREEQQAGHFLGERLGFVIRDLGAA